MALVGPWLMHLAPPALLQARGSLFHWEPGWATQALFLPAYWLLVVFAMVAFVYNRRRLWWLLLVLVLAATIPRLGLLVYTALLVT